MSKRIIIAGGGTGGHLFPGIAVAKTFLEKDLGGKVLFVGSGKSFERSVAAKYGFDYEAITSEGIKGRGIVNQAKALAKIPVGIFQSFCIFRRFKPDLVLGVGGYSSGPVVMAAKLSGIPVVLHEQNTIPGITNRMLSHLADRIYISFEYSKSFFNIEKVIFSGNPVRKEILNIGKPSVHKVHRFTVAIIGGSQGAHRINTAVIQALELLEEKSKFHFIHQTRTEDQHNVKQAYTRNGISFTARPFFDDMPALYRQADLIICRAGATTIAEITAIGKAAIFIPFPFAADNHQAKNAQVLADAGAAEMINEKELTGNLLAKKIQRYVSNPEALNKMAEKAKKFGKPDAAEVIVRDWCRHYGWV